MQHSLPLINRDNTCCFSGYRPEKLPWEENEDDPRCGALIDKLAVITERIHQTGIRHFITGMARGCDTFFCEAVLNLREKAAVTVEAAIPYERQAARWREEERERYRRLLERCDHLTYVGREYTRSCNLRRNRYMVDNSSVMIAVYDGKPGGTKYTLEYASRRNLEIIIIEP